MNLFTLATLLYAATTSFSLDNLKPGLQGECLTVFAGTQVESMGFEVLGRMPHYLGPGKDVVMVRLLGDKPNFTGVVQGMSGSPCSIDGKLLGALAYAFMAFAKEPIAGITPIESMREINTLPAEALPWAKLSAQVEPPLNSANDKPEISTGAARVTQPEGLQPIATPLQLVGVPNAVREHFEPWLRSMHMTPVGGGGLATDAQTHIDIPLVPGGSIAAVLMRGDVNAAATGTVTTIEGNRVLAFGHPFFGLGAVSFPMAGASVLHTMVSSLQSFKMATIGKTTGEITQDRLTAIAGVIGSVATMIPIVGEIDAPQGKSTFKLEVVRDLSLSPNLVAMGIASAVSGRVAATSRGTVELNGLIETAHLPPLPVHNVFSAQRDNKLMTAAGLEMGDALKALWYTPFGLPDDVRLHVKIRISPDPHSEVIEGLYLDKQQVRPGEAVHVAVRLRELVNSAHQTLHFRLTVPQSWAGQELEVVAAGVQEAERVAQDINGAPKPTQLSDIGEWLAARRTNGHVYVMLLRNGINLQTAVHNYPNIPSSAAAILGNSLSHANRSQSIAWEEKQPRAGVVAGSVRSQLRVLAY